MGTREKVDWAIENSVHWYDALCAAHEVPGEHHAAYWINRQVMPPYMSQLITLRDAEATEVQLAALRSLIEEGKDHGVKDSFRCLSLESLGLEVLFHATWIFRSPETPPPDDDVDLRWRVVGTADELRLWERTWRGVDDNAQARDRPVVFRDSLRQRSDFRFLLGERRGEPVATAALNDSGHAVGISNVFSAQLEPARLFQGCIRAARSLFPERPLVGYERAAHLDAAIATGFEAIGGLTVWVPAPRA